MRATLRLLSAELLKGLGKQGVRKRPGQRARQRQRRRDGCEETWVEGGARPPPPPPPKPTPRPRDASPVHESVTRRVRNTPLTAEEDRAAGHKAKTEAFLATNRPVRTQEFHRDFSNTVVRTRGAKVSPFVHKEAILKLHASQGDPYHGFGSCSDSEGAAVIITMELRHTDGGAGRRQVNATPSESRNLAPKLRSKVQLMERNGFDIGLETHNACLYVLKMHQLFRQCVYWMTWMEEVYHTKPDVKAYNTTLAAHVKASPADVVPLFTQMLKGGPTPNAATYTILLQVVPEDRLEATLEYKQKSGFKPDIFDYNTILGRCRSYAELEPWLKRMEEGGMGWDKFTLGGILKALAPLGDVQRAEEAFAKATDTYRVQHDTSMYTALLGVYQRTQSWDGFAAVWRRMFAAKVRPNRHTYLCKARMLTRCASPASAAAHLEEVEAMLTSAELANALSPAIWTEVFRSLAKTRDVKGAHKMGAAMFLLKPKLPQELHIAYRAAAKEEYKAVNFEKDKNLSIWQRAESTYATRKVMQGRNERRGTETGHHRSRSGPPVSGKGGGGGGGGGDRAPVPRLL